MALRKQARGLQVRLRWQNTLHKLRSCTSSGWVCACSYSPRGPINYLVDWRVFLVSKRPCLKALKVLTFRELLPLFLGARPFPQHLPQPRAVDPLVPRPWLPQVFPGWNRLPCLQLFPKSSRLGLSFCQLDSSSKEQHQSRYKRCKERRSSF
jgi:hypothetical protein